jgi:hypothetical protein
MTIELVKYRDAFLPTYTWFWVDENRKLISPFFDKEEDALAWSGAREISNSIVVTPSK